MKIYQLLLLSFLFINLSLSLPFACGNCVGRNEICTAYNHQCADNLKCVNLYGSKTAPICLPTIEKNQECDHIKEYDACEFPSFTCDRNGTKKCEGNFFAGLNDECINDRYCKPGLTCQGGKCRQLSPGACLSGDNCGWNEYCAGNTGIGGVCRPRMETFGNCNYTAVCKYAHTCLLNRCVPYYTIEEGGECLTLQDCKPGLECYKEPGESGPLHCTKPKYYLLIGPSPTVAWGPECDPYNVYYSFIIGGCRCDYGLHIYRHAKEEGKTMRDFCKIRTTNFATCMENNGCSSVNNGADTCMRKYCYAHYKDMTIDCAVDPSSVVFCGASSISIFVMMIVLFILFL